MRFQLLRELHPAFWLLVVVVLLLMAGGWSLWQSYKRRNIWQRFARRYRLRYEEPSPGKPQVTGQFDGRALRLALADSGSDREGTYATVLTLAVNRAPAALEIHQGGVIGAAEKMIDGEVIETGDADFDRQAVVHGASAEIARDYLTPGRRQALMALLTLGADYRTGLDRGRLFVESRHLMTRLSDLEEQFTVLRRTAAALDADS